MAINTDKNSYTVLFATAMVIVVGTLLAFVASYFKEQITENKRIEKQQNILYAMGVNENDETSVEFVSKSVVGQEFSKYITKQYVVIGTEAVEDSKAYLIDIKKEAAAAKNPTYKRRLPLFVGEKDNATFYIIPVRGKGLWDAIWGYVAIDNQLVVQGVFFDHAGETPGLGSNIKERFFMDDFKGEYIMSGDVFTGITVAKGNNDPINKIKDDYEIDALAGATITGNGITAMIKKDLKMYIPYLTNLTN